MQMIACRLPGCTNIRNVLALHYPIANRYPVARIVGVQCTVRAVVLNDNRKAITAAPASQNHISGGGGIYSCACRGGYVNT